jgi:hypothetical protein
MLCEQENGATIFVKCTPGDYIRPPQVGAKITVRHQGFFAQSQKYKYPVLLDIKSEVKKSQNNNIEQLNNIKKSNDNGE